MKTIEVYKGFNIFEAEGDYLLAGFNVQVDISPLFPTSTRHMGLKSIDMARKEIDWMFESMGKTGLD